MNQQPQASLIHNPLQPEATLVQIGDRLYQITELRQQPQSLSPQPIPSRSSLWDSPTALIGFGVAAVLLTGLVTAGLMKAFFVPATVPTVAPAQPQTIIVQPPQPEKRPYTRRDCKPAGLFGWGSECVEERGYE